MPGGDRCVLQVLATEGIRTGEARTPPFRTPRKSPKLFIASPADGAAFKRGDVVTLVGEGFSPDSGSVAGKSLVWHSDRAGTLGRGHQLRLRSLGTGRHRISLSTSDAKDSVAIEIDITPPYGHGHTSASHPKHSSEDHRSGKLASK